MGTACPRWQSQVLDCKILDISKIVNCSLLHSLRINLVMSIVYLRSSAFYASDNVLHVWIDVAPESLEATAQIVQSELG